MKKIQKAFKGIFLLIICLLFNTLNVDAAEAYTTIIEGDDVIAIAVLENSYVDNDAFYLSLELVNNTSQTVFFQSDNVTAYNANGECCAVGEIYEPISADDMTTPDAKFTMTNGNDASEIVKIEGDFYFTNEECEILGTNYCAIDTDLSSIDHSSDFNTDEYGDIAFENDPYDKYEEYDNGMEPFYYNELGGNSYGAVDLEQTRMQNNGNWYIIDSNEDSESYINTDCMINVALVNSYETEEDFIYSYINNLGDLVASVSDIEDSDFTGFNTKKVIIKTVDDSYIILYTGRDSFDEKTRALLLIPVEGYETSLETLEIYANDLVCAWSPDGYFMDKNDWEVDDSDDYSYDDFDYDTFDDSKTYTINNDDTAKTMTMAGGTMFVIGLICFGVIMIIVIISLILMAKIYKKAGKPGWAIIVPIYNQIVFSEILFGNKTSWLRSFIPFYNIYWGFRTILCYAKVFGYGTGMAILFIFVPVTIFIPALSKNAEYLGYCDAHNGFELVYLDDDYDYDEDDEYEDDEYYDEDDDEDDYDED